MARRVRGVLVREGVQTGDGRVIAANALTWPDLPLPLAWLQQEQHGDLSPGGVQVGTIDTITRAGDGAIEWTGQVDDAQADGAEMVRRMTEGTAPFGTRWGISIDPDDYEVQIVNTSDDAEDVLLLASGRGRLAVTAAAGDPDEEPDDAAILFEDAADSILQRYTRMRIRGATACAIPAFADAYMELDGEADTAAADDAPAEDAAPATVAASSAPVRPPACWFAMPEPQLGDDLLVEQPSGTFAVPLTITDDGQVFGHIAAKVDHTAYPGVKPPTSPSGYAHFHVGEVVCDQGERVATGVLVVGTDHAAIDLMAPGARDWYANTGMGWADVRVVDGQWGPWCRGALRPGLTPEVVRVLRASALSGDWRRYGGHLELICALSVNSPGFPIAREAMVASGLAELPTATPATHAEDGVLTALVASSGLVVRCPECAERARMATRLGQAHAPAEVMELLRTLEYRTRHLVPDARDHALARIRGVPVTARR